MDCYNTQGISYTSVTPEKTSKLQWCKLYHCHTNLVALHRVSGVYNTGATRMFIPDICMISVVNFCVNSILEPVLNFDIYSGVAPMSVHRVAPMFSAQCCFNVCSQCCTNVCAQCCFNVLSTVLQCLWMVLLQCFVLSVAPVFSAQCCCNVCSQYCTNVCAWCSTGVILHRSYWLLHRCSTIVVVTPCRKFASAKLQYRPQVFMT